MIWGQKISKKCIFELKSDILKIRGKWSLEKPFVWPKKTTDVDYFEIYGCETKFSYKNSYQKNVFTHSFPRNQLFLILETISVIIYWHFGPKTRKTKTFILT